MKKRIKFSKGFKIVLVFAAAFLVGEAAGRISQALWQEDAAEVGAFDNVGQTVEQTGYSWGLSFQEEGKPPVSDAGAEELAKYDAYYMEETDEKVLYLTFDAGYENGNMTAILDALKKHDAPAAFFVVGHYLESSPELVRRMLDEGHVVANHSFHHPDMSGMGEEEFQKELSELESLYQEKFGQELAKFYRPPQGKYSENSLNLAKNMGYQTIFWSLAYKDWDVEQQPSHEEALDKLTSRVHPGAIVLLHSTSKTNGEILDELLTRWEEMGYRFKSLEELPERADAKSASHS